MEDYDYEKWVEYLESILTMRDTRPETIADLACGTGNFTTRLAKRGYNIIGIDYSADMLYVARDKSLTMGLNIPFIHQDIRSLSLQKSVDIITCMCDGFNYILSDYDLVVTFQKIYNSLNKGGALIFDISSYYKLENTLGNNLMADASEDISLIWFNFFDKEDAICQMDLTFFVKEESEYIRFDETHYQRAYKLDFICKSLEQVGFLDVKAYSPFTFDPPNHEDQRWVFIAEK